MTNPNTQEVTKPLTIESEVPTYNHQVSYQTNVNPVKRVFNIIQATPQNALYNGKMENPQIPYLKLPVDINNDRQIRQQKIDRYRAKRNKRIWKKEIKYTTRKVLADKRIRSRGRFLTKSQEKEQVVKNNINKYKLIIDKRRGKKDKTKSIK